MSDSSKVVIHGVDKDGMVYSVVHNDVLKTSYDEQMYSITKKNEKGEGNTTERYNLDIVSVIEEF